LNIDIAGPIRPLNCGTTNNSKINQFCASLTAIQWTPVPAQISGWLRPRVSGPAE
jgi:hypothetical protein